MDLTEGELPELFSRQKILLKSRKKSGGVINKSEF